MTCEFGFVYPLTIDLYQGIVPSLFPTGNFPYWELSSLSHLVYWELGLAFRLRGCTDWAHGYRQPTVRWGALGTWWNSTEDCTFVASILPTVTGSWGCLSLSFGCLGSDSGSWEGCIFCNIFGDTFETTINLLKGLVILKPLKGLLPGLYSHIETDILWKTWTFIFKRIF